MDNIDEIAKYYGVPNSLIETCISETSLLTFSTSQSVYECILERINQGESFISDSEKETEWLSIIKNIKETKLRHTMAAQFEKKFPDRKHKYADKFGKIYEMDTVDGLTLKFSQNKNFEIKIIIQGNTFIIPPGKLTLPKDLIDELDYYELSAEARQDFEKQIFYKLKWKNFHTLKEEDEEAENDSYEEEKEIIKDLSVPFLDDVHLKANKILNDIVPGTHLVPNKEDRVEITNLLDREPLFKLKNNGSNVILKLMKSGKCHENTKELLKTKKIKKGYTGYALTRDDGLWRHHSWGVDDKGMVVETTKKRAFYVGVTQWELFMGKYVIKTTI